MQPSVDNDGKKDQDSDGQGTRKKTGMAAAIVAAAAAGVGIYIGTEKNDADPYVPANVDAGLIYNSAGSASQPSVALQYAIKKGINAAAAEKKPDSGNDKDKEFAQLLTSARNGDTGALRKMGLIKEALEDEGNSDEIISEFFGISQQELKEIDSAFIIKKTLETLTRGSAVSNTQKGDYGRSNFMRALVDLHHELGDNSPSPLFYQFISAEK